MSARGIGSLFGARNPPTPARNGPPKPPGTIASARGPLPERELLERGGGRSLTRPVPEDPWHSEAFNAIDEQLRQWAQQVHLSPGEVYLAAVRAALGPGESVEAAVIFQGVEVLVELALCSGAAAGRAATLRSTVLGARTRCTWEVPQRLAAAAARSAHGSSIEAFMGAYLVALRRGEAGDITKSALEGASGASTTTRGGRPGSPRSLAENSSEDESPRSPRPAEPDPRTPQRGAPNRRSVVGQWILEREPLWRCEHASVGLGWDYPLSKAEKKELLLLTFAAEEERLERR